MPLWKRLFPTATRLNLAIQLFSLTAIFFEGYDRAPPSSVSVQDPADLLRGVQRVSWEEVRHPASSSARRVRCS